MIRRLFRATLGVVLLGGALGLHALPAQSQPAQWSLQRTSFGFDAKAALRETGERTTAFMPGAYLSWSATSQMSLAATVEYDFTNDLVLSRAGGRFLIARMGDGGQVGAGASLVGYSGDGAVGITEPTSWEASLHAAYPVAENAGRTVLWGVLSARFDPENNFSLYTIGLRWQAIGGNE